MAIGLVVGLVEVVLQEAGVRSLSTVMVVGAGDLLTVMVVPRGSKLDTKRTGVEHG